MNAGPRTPRDTEAITLVGAGLAGSLLAILLARRGHRVTLHERRADPRKAAGASGRSINLALANRGIHALERAGLIDRVRPATIPMAGRMLHDEDGRLQLVPYGNKPHEVIHSVSRGELNAILLDEAERTGRVSIRFGETCAGADFSARRVRVRAPDQTLHDFPYAVLVGTDGSASAVRTALIDRTRGEVDEQPLGHGYKELTIPAAPGGGFRMEKNALHI
ncbi:MAG TPA: NAD(P)/FAD-dependent oxidoreductase, partial [Thermoanaerobaculia bacterium]|nr:NAD(P)/FAD-dependent oxidoreductase [Thermoanaerobaculia bacterium]